LLDLHPEQFKNAGISLVSVNGKRVLRGKASVSAAGEPRISRRNVATGVYLLSVRGADGNSYAARIVHNGGKLDIGVAFTGESVSPATPEKKADAGFDHWKITAEPNNDTLYNDTLYTFFPVKGANPTQIITLSQTPSEVPRVFFTSDISSDGLIAAYNALGVVPAAEEKVAVKLHTGEQGNPHYLKANIIKDLIQGVNGTIVETNTAYPGSQRATTAQHLQVAKDHGFTAIATVDIMDTDGNDSLNIAGGTRIQKNFVGKSFRTYDFHIVLSHFKGHQMGGFGGALKNLSIGYASKMGKCWIHTAGKSRTSFSGGVQDSFLVSMAEAAKSIVDHANKRIVFVTVMNNISIDCDCMSSPAAPKIPDIGILASLDPVALDQACIDKLEGVQHTDELWEKRINPQNGLLTINHAAKIGLGTKSYQYINISPK
jgi:uncharacterized Fe-S center protein